MTASVTDMAIYGILILVGLMICFLGYRLIRIWLFLAGLQVGFFLGLWLGDMIFKSPTVVMISAILLGIIMAGLFGMLIKVGGFLAGAAVLVLLALLITQLLGISENIRLFILLGAAIIGGVLGVLTIKPFLILATAVNGAYLAAASVFNLVSGHPVGQSVAIQSEMKTAHLILILAAVLVLTILGAMVQFRMERRKREKAIVKSVPVSPPPAPVACQKTAPDAEQVEMPVEPDQPDTEKPQ